MYSIGLQWVVYKSWNVAYIVATLIHSYWATPTQHFGPFGDVLGVEVCVERGIATLTIISLFSIMSIGFW